MDDDERVIYDAAWRKAEVFFEWRHKVMLFSVSIVGAGIVATGWMIKDATDAVVVGSLLVYLALVLFVIWLMDRRVAIHMKDAYRAGALIEGRIRARHAEWGISDDVLPLGALLHLREQKAAIDRGSITFLLSCSYRATAAILAIVGILIMFKVIPI